MQGLAAFLFVVHLVVGLLNVLIARPLIQRRIAPNGLYGFRTRKTFSDPKIWYEANAYSGICLQRAGLATLLAGVVLLIASPLFGYLPAPNNQLIYLASGLLILVVPVTASVIASYRHLSRIAP